jgi:cell division protein FtsB
MRHPALMKLLLFAIASGAIATSTALDSKGFGRYEGLREAVAQLKDKNAALAQENLRLAREVDALQHDPRYQERAVREELGLIRPGELVLDLDEPRDPVAIPPAPTGRLSARPARGVARGGPR